MYKVLFISLFLLKQNACATQGPRQIYVKQGHVKNAPLNVRKGPDINYPVVFQITKKYTPIQVMYKIDNWCMITNYAGQKGWVICAAITIKSQISILKSKTNLYRIPMKEKIAALKPFTQVKIIRCTKNYCRIAIGDITGWINRLSLWQ
jgi:SH3-like domain-containing protein